MNTKIGGRALKFNLHFLKDRKFQVGVGSTLSPPTPTTPDILQEVLQSKEYLSQWESCLVQKSRTMQQGLENISGFLSQSGLSLSDKSAYIDKGNKPRIKNYPGCMLNEKEGN